MLAPDKRLHLLYGISCSHLVFVALMLRGHDLATAAWVGVAVTTAIGIGKEIFDRVTGRGQAELADALVTLVGMLPMLPIILNGKGLSL